VQEHRKDTRVPVRLEVEWGGWPSRYPDVTSDVSLGGCYVESLNPVKVGEVLNLSLCLPANKTLRFRGEVRYHQPTIGFGLRFLQLSPFEQATLAALIRYWAKRARFGRLAAAPGNRASMKSSFSR
jgi:PilZ domain-containing protein